MLHTKLAAVVLSFCLAGCAQRSAGGEAPGELPALVETSAERSSEAEDPPVSYFSRLWKLDPETRKGGSAITPHRPSYFIPVSYNDSPNVDAVRQADPTRDLDRLEALFQLSFKVKLWEDLLGNNVDIWCGYTQRSFWQVYDRDNSSPFRETNYEPELLFNVRTDYDLFGLRGRFVNLGLNHQSNGQSEPLSRSWNRVVASLGLERGPFSLLGQGWYRIRESVEDDDNPKIERYLGYGQLWARYFLDGHMFGLMLRNNFALRDNRGAVQVEWAFPLLTLTQVQGYVQYFNGYGESLLDYDHRVNRVSAGFMLTL